MSHRVEALPKHKYRVHFPDGHTEDVELWHNCTPFREDFQSIVGAAVVQRDGLLAEIDKLTEPESR